MKWQAFVLVLILVLVIVFAALNWETFMAPNSLNLVVRRVEAPLGAGLLALIALLTALYLVFVASARTTQLVETRRFAKEAAEARQLADREEASRFSELRSYLEQELETLRTVVQEEGGATRDRLSEAAEALGTALDESHNSLVANLAEMDSRPGAPSTPPEGGLSPHDAD